MILDVHTHLPAPRPDGIISASPEEIETLYDLFPEQLWSAGYHPWHIASTGLSEEQIERLGHVARLERVVAVGETGIDKTRLVETPLFAQINAFKVHTEVALETGKPLILHAVKAQDVIIPLLDEELTAVIIHGFRQKPAIAEMYLRAGCYLSFGEKFNPESLLLTPMERILAETDCSSQGISSIIEQLHSSRPDITPALITANISSLLKTLH